MDAAYVGDFANPDSTETKIVGALERLGHHVDRYPERTVDWPLLQPNGYDVVLWTRTRRDELAQTQFQGRCRAAKVPVVAIHLDLFWGLRRQNIIADSPFFRCDQVWTADGGNDKQWRAVGVEHRWMPPAADVVTGVPAYVRQFTAGFFGSVDNYHAEHPHRKHLVDWLRTRYAGLFAHFGRGGRPDVRGRDLDAAMASCRIIVGDSCFSAGHHYWSDRVPEALARGAVLVHTDIDGLREQHPSPNLLLWKQGDWNQLNRRLDEALTLTQVAGPVEALSPWNTWEHRIRTMLDGL